MPAPLKAFGIGIKAPDGAASRQQLRRAVADDPLVAS